MLVNQYLQQPYPEWAIVAAYGDNLDHSAEQLADTLMLSTEQRERLKQLGIYINYNGYGASIEDLHIHPAELFNILIQFKSPFDIIQQRGDLFRQLQEAYQSDMEQAAALQPLEADEKTAVYLLPDASWARRISGVFGNQLANQAPDRAHAIITRTPAGNFQISVRAPLNLKTGADELCARFPGGGGRKAAAGINQLPESQLEQFISTFKQHYS